MRQRLLFITLFAIALCALYMVPARFSRAQDDPNRGVPDQIGRAHV